MIHLNMNGYGGDKALSEYSVTYEGSSNVKKRIAASTFSEIRRRKSVLPDQ